MTIPIALHCPSCETPLNARAWSCSQCHVVYPSLAGIPFLFPKPDLELARWEARAHHEQQNLRAQKIRCDEALRVLERRSGNRDMPTQDQTKLRLERLSTAYEAQLACISELLAPLLLDHPGSNQTTYQAMKTELLADNTTLFGYTTNLFRDWVWGEAENAQSIEMLRSVAPGSLGTTLVLGSGAGRLAWDLANGPATHVTAVDINPFTTLAAARISSASVKGEGLRLWEFPMAPISREDVALERTLFAPAVGKADNIEFLLADARALPFGSSTFDTVVTPWFTDVVQQTPAETAQLINGLLKNNGRWLNFGSVAFANANPEDCFLLAELCNLVADNGFGAPAVIEERGPYLCSPHSRFGRTELLHAFCAKKNLSVRQNPRRNELPVWLKATATPVPALPAFADQAMATQVHAYLLSLIDGKRTINDIAQVLEERRLMSAREAVPVVQGFLRKIMNQQ